MTVLKSSPLRSAWGFCKLLVLPLRWGRWNPVALLVWFVVGVGVVLGWMEQAEARECASVGGRIVQTGTRTMFVYDAALKMTRPQQISIRECVPWEKP